MASIGIPNSLKVEVPKPRTNVEDEQLQMTRAELQAQLKAAAGKAHEAGIARGRELQREEEASAFSDLRDTLESQRDNAAAGARKLEAALIDVGDELKRIEGQMAEAMDTACCAVATQFLLSVEASADVVAGLVERLAEDYRASGIVVRVNAEIATELEKAFAEHEFIDVRPIAKAEALSIELTTASGNYEYFLQGAYEQLRDLLSTKVLRQS